LFEALTTIFGGGKEHAAAEREAAALDEQMAATHPLRILLAEDNVYNQKLAVRLLAQMGYSADVAGNGLEAIQSLERQDYDVVLMDVQMPELDGLEASRRICSRWNRHERPRIIAMTANAMHGDRELCLHAGMDDYVTKPIRTEELVAALRRAPSRLRVETGPPSDAAAAADGVSASRLSPPPEGPSEPSPSAPSLRPEVRAEAAAPLREADASPLDCATLRRLSGAMGDDFMPELIGAFLADSGRLVADLQRAVAEGDAGLLRRSAHTVKSQGASLGALRLADLCRMLEEMGAAENLCGALELVSAAAEERARVRDALTAYLEEERNP
jgi:CheY-like chemotaxis protein